MRAGITKVLPAGSCAPHAFAVIFARYDGKWIFARHKARTTWETAGGHIEPGETPVEAARRELFEETGALEAEITPVCDYRAGDRSGMVFLAEVKAMGALPESEMAEIGFFDGSAGCRRI